MFALLTNGKDNQVSLNTGPHDSLEGKLLIAMPSMTDTRFERAVIFMCAHTGDGGAMGLIINKPLSDLTFDALISQMDIDRDQGAPDVPLQFGGPVETRQGFVLHSPDMLCDGSMILHDEVALTATIDILKAIACGEGPDQAIVAMGYAGWAPGQLESEIQRNDWLHSSADRSLMFEKPLTGRWDAAIQQIGVDPGLLSSQAGHA